MEIRHLLKSQTNQVFETITAAHWEPIDFEWQDVHGPASRQLVSSLVHLASNYYFIFDNAKSVFNSRWSPGEQTLEQTQGASSWPMQLKFLNLLLGYLRREIESPDLWGAISEEARILDAAASDDTSNIPFTPQEKAYILEGINEIKQYLLTAHRLDLELVESRLKYLVESSERLGRKDWLNLLISVLISIVINAALPPEAIRELFRFAGTVLQQIIHQPLLLP